MPSSPAGPVSIREAREMSGLRVILIRGVPSPWSQAVRGILRIKEIDYTCAYRAEDDPPGILEEWTGQASFPAVMLDDDRPRSGWAEILLLAEQRVPKPALLPADATQRAICLGWSHEICGEMGLGWCRRLEGVEAALQREKPDPISKWLGDKYGYTPATGAESSQRVRDILRGLTQRLKQEQSNGNRFLMGPALTALDVYWATFCNLVSPLPPEQLELPERMRPIFESRDEETRSILKEGLLEHRDFIYQDYLELPVVL